MDLYNLRIQATQQALDRGHLIKWLTPWHGESKSLQTGICEQCQLEVLVNTNPLPEKEIMGYCQMLISGDALKLDCKNW